MVRKLIIFAVIEGTARKVLFYDFLENFLRFHVNSLSYTITLTFFHVKSTYSERWPTFV